MTAGPCGLGDVIERATGRRPQGLKPLGGGCVGEVMAVYLDDGSKVVAKLGPGLEPEGWMLGFLAAHSRLPMPKLLVGSDDLLLMEYVEGNDPLNDSAQEHAAELLAELHSLTWTQFGLERDTVIGGLAQPNPPTRSWVEFFRDHRLLYMAGEGLKIGQLPRQTMARIERLAGRLERWIDEPGQPSLIHGDAWGGNILCRAGRVAAFIDPAISYSDPEIELAFGTLFSTFGDAFFRRYREIRPLDDGFFEVRRDLYNLYPLLVHVRLFGGGYLAGVEGILDRLVG